MNFIREKNVFEMGQSSDINLKKLYHFIIYHQVSIYHIAPRPHHSLKRAVSSGLI